jgi:uncharacterized OB-fold protein
MNKYLTDQDIEEFFQETEKKNKPKLKCKNCGRMFLSIAPGTNNRNHCPYCLYSIHVDENVGDRKAKCGGLMKPVGKFLRPNNEEVLVHKCTVCGKVSNNRIAGDDNEELVNSLPMIDSSMR